MSSADETLFENKVRPILKTHCFDCHGEDEAKNKLRLDTTVGMLRGGESGEPLLIAGKSDESYLIRRVTATNKKDLMPPDGPRLSVAEIATLRAWIDQGAKLPGAAEAAAALQLKTDHWSFQPVKRPPVSRAGHEIDELVLAKLAEKRLTMSSPADRETLIRRLYLVMHGLPPTPHEVREFLDDKLADAYERLVERVLNSPRFGERWARHWMDVVRYADTNGFETNRERKTAYHYRDYLIEALNADKPYDQFVKEQIAGDAMGADAATGFLVAGPYDIVKSRDITLTLMQRQDELADMVNTTGTAFLGLTMGCARCHSHKFDPIPQKDYYAIQAVFAGVTHGERPVRSSRDAAQATELAAVKAELTAKEAALAQLANRAPPASTPTSSTPMPVAAKPGTLRPAVTAKFNEESFPPVEARAVKFVILASSGGAPCLDELEVFDDQGKNVALAANGGKATASGTIDGYEIHKLEHVNDGRFGNGRSWIASSTASWVQIDLASPARIQRIVWSRDREERYSDRVATGYKIEAATATNQWVTVASSTDRLPFAGAKPNSKPKAQDGLDERIARLAPGDAATARKLQAELSELKSRLEKLSESNNAWIGKFTNPPQTFRLYRGEPMQKREPVAPDALSVLGSLGMDMNEPEQRRRVRLAEWIASAENPLTARVMVNRLWHYTFGNGINDTPSDFGANGGRPTHPELLDWLADEFVRHGWSIKHVLRRIVLSDTFRQSSAPRADALAIDADGRYLWRYTPRRLEAEAIRDSMLAASGALDLKMGGVGFYLMDVVRENVVHYFPKETFTPAEFRRMVYLFRIRTAHDGVFGSFDCPDGGSVMPKRSRSNTPLQALNLFNSGFIAQQSEILAKRLSAEAGASPEAQVQLAFQICYARAPDTFELAASAKLIRDHGLPSFARAVFNTSEFLFVF